MGLSESLDNSSVTHNQYFLGFTAETKPWSYQRTQYYFFTVSQTGQLQSIGSVWLSDWV